jgi:hypothetical protein
MSLFDRLALLENNDSLHLGRLLVLLSAFVGKDETGSVDGLTKLAKLDFLLRYPVNLERALQVRGGRGADAKVEDYERKSIESGMVRYRFGPWDFRYRRFLNTLVSRGLVGVTTEGRTIKIRLTLAGREVAEELSSAPEFATMARRAKLLKRHCDLSATNLMKFIYETFPELGAMRAGTRIPQ